MAKPRVFHNDGNCRTDQPIKSRKTQKQKQYQPLFQPNVSPVLRNQTDRPEKEIPTVKYRIRQGTHLEDRVAVSFQDIGRLALFYSSLRIASLEDARIHWL